MLLLLTAVELNADESEDADDEGKVEDCDSLLDAIGITFHPNIRRYRYKN